MHNLPLSSVVHRCRQESVRYLDGQVHDPAFCHELFRRAIVEKDESAWQAVYDQYVHRTPLVMNWIQHHPSFAATQEQADYFANRAFARFWSALTAERFRQFSDLKSLLRYLKMCVNGAIVDHVRTMGGHHGTLSLEFDLTGGQEEPAINLVHQQLEGEDIWRLITTRLHNEKEELVLFCRYVEGLKPSQICKAYPQLFSDVEEVYKMLQAMLARLRRDPQLRRYVFDENDESDD